MNESYNYDIVFCSLPPMSVDRIYSAPALLKGSVEAAGYRSRCFDFNLDFFAFCNHDLNTFGRISNYFTVRGVKLKRSDRRILSKYYDHIINTLLTANSKYIGLSVFSYYTQRIVVELLIRFYCLGMHDRIVLGGRGLSTLTSETVADLLNLPNEDRSFELVEILRARGLLVHGIIGDGENAVVDFLNTGSIGQQQNKLDTLDICLPNYSDYDFNSYVWPDGVPALDVIGSTGCVRACDFCDIKKQFGSYKFKNGKAFAEELIHLQQVYKINKFILADSLSNGGLKIFREFLNRLVEHNSSSATPISWTGQYICRDLQTLPDVDDYYKSIALSGGHGLTIGAESGSDYVLYQMNKKTTVEALFFELEHFKRWGITCQILTFVGHWSERHEDFIQHCDMLVNLMPYVRDGVIGSVNLGRIYALLPGTPSFENINIKVDKNLGIDFWSARNNRGNTFKVRLQRRLIISKLTDRLQLGVSFDESSNLQHSYEIAKQYKKEFNEFYGFNTHGDNSQFIPIADADKFVDDFLNQPSPLSITLTVEANACINDPELTVKLNQRILQHGPLPQGEHTFNFSLTNNELFESNQLLMQLTNKGPNDTEVDKYNNIIRDKNIIIKKLIINHCDLINDFDFFYDQFYYIDSGVKVKGKPGLWNQHPLCLNFKTPFVPWYAVTSNKNKSNKYTAHTKKEMQGLYSAEEFFKKISNIVNELII